MFSFTMAVSATENDFGTIGHLLPESSWWEKIFLYLTIYVAFSAYITFLVSIVFKIKISSARCSLVVQILTNLFLMTAPILIAHWVDYPLTHISSDDCFQKVCYALGMFIVLEAAASSLQRFLELRQRARLNPSLTTAKSEVSDSGKQVFPITWRFSWFLLYLGTGCVRNACKAANDHHYEYLGPMRVTKLPSLYFSEKMFPYEDQYKLFPCLLKHQDYFGELYGETISQPNVVAILDIGWGKSWGCRTNIDRWNTNRPQWTPCTNFVCREDGTSTCDCYPDEASAREATMECLERTFDWTLLRQNVTYSAEQPPWEDSFASPWPTVTRYGNCDLHVATAISHVDKVRRNTEQQWWFGLVVLAVWSLTLRVLRRQWF
jgi:hypothetical protein